MRAAAIADLGAVEEADGTLAIPIEGVPSSDLATVLTIAPDADATVVTARRRGHIDIPFFGWFFATARRGSPATGPPRTRSGRCDTRSAKRPRRNHRAASSGSRTSRSRPNRRPCSPRHRPRWRSRRSPSAIFGQLAGPIGDSFHASDATLSNALAITRLGAILALFATALADRRGRRRAILIGVVGTAFACALSAVAPTLVIFTAAQVLQRAFVNTTLIVAGIAVIEEAPEGARAYSASMLALAAGFGFSFAVVALLIDIGDNGWRLAYVAGTLTLLLAPRIARALTETTRYKAVAARTEIRRGQLRELMTGVYGRRFALLAAIGFLANIFNAPSSQLMNKYLEDVRDFSSPGIALFRTVTTGLPGLVGLVVGGRLAEQRGRKPVAIVALLIATTTQMVFFLAGRHDHLDHVGGLGAHLGDGGHRARHARRRALPHRAARHLQRAAARSSA